MVVLDTSFLIDLIQKDVRAVEKLKDLENNNEMICTTIINALELFWGGISFITSGKKSYPGE